MTQTGETGRFSGKAVLVTAAASGIGEATAAAFAREGASVMLSDLDAERGETVARSLSEGGANVRFTMADGTRETDVERLVRATVEAYGALDCAINVIGGSTGERSFGNLHLQDLAGWDGTFAITLTSAFLCLKHEIAYMLERGGGAIVNVSSLAGMHFVPDAGVAYSTAKAGIIHLTRFAAMSYADRGIRVNCIAPGTTDTAALSAATRVAGAEDMVARLLEGHVIKRMIAPYEQAEAILYLCSDAAAMITGHALPVDGGWNAR